MAQTCLLFFSSNSLSLSLHFLSLTLFFLFSCLSFLFISEDEASGTFLGGMIMAVGSFELISTLHHGCTLWPKFFFVGLFAPFLQ